MRYMKVKASQITSNLTVWLKFCSRYQRITLQNLKVSPLYQGIPPKVFHSAYSHMHYKCCNINWSWDVIVLKVFARSDLSFWMISKKIFEIIYNYMGSIVLVNGLAHYSDVTMSAKASQITDVLIVCSTICSWKKTSKLCLTKGQ